MDVDKIKSLISDILLHPAVAGCIGALISILWHKPTLSVIVMHILAGVFGALYGTQPIIEWQGISESLSNIVALMIGAFAGSLFGTIFQFIHSGKLSDLLHDFISHRFIDKPHKTDRGNKHE